MNESGPILPSISLLGMELAVVTSEALLEHIFSSLDAGKGGWVVTANLDYMRRFTRDPSARSLYQSADIRVADGMPLVWASRLQGEALPERIAGASIISDIVRRAAERNYKIFILGGPEHARLKAIEVWLDDFPTLQIVGQSGPTISDRPNERQLAIICQDLVRANPNIVLCGFGSPKQEYVLQAVRKQLPSVWTIGIGGSFSFVAGEIQRAPNWMQENGLEWLYRLAQEPRRLAKRYLVEDMPFALELFSQALLKRVRQERR